MTIKGRRNGRWFLLRTLCSRGHLLSHCPQVAVGFMYCNVVTWRRSCTAALFPIFNPTMLTMCNNAVQQLWPVHPVSATVFGSGARGAEQRAISRLPATNFRAGRAVFPAFPRARSCRSPAAVLWSCSCVCWAIRVRAITGETDCE